MKIISFVCQKGGTGKTTLALNLAVEAMRRGSTVAVIDLDPQPSACGWSDLRGEGAEPVVIDAKPARLPAAIEAARHAGDIDLLVIDTGGRTEEGAFAAAKASDLVVVPLQPSAVDLKSIPATRDLITMAGRPDILCLLTRVKPFGTRHAEIASWLAANELPVCETTIGDRVTFQDAYAAGQAVSEYDPRGKAAEEMQTATTEILAAAGMQNCRHVNKKKNGVADHGTKKAQSRRAR